MSETNPSQRMPGAPHLVPGVPVTPGVPTTPGVRATTRRPETTGRPVTTGRAGTDAVRREIAQAILADPGVLRVEPTLATVVRSWSTAPDPEDLVRLTLTGGTGDVAVHLAVQGDEARLVAHRVREVVRELLVEHGLEPGSVEVSVLTVEPVTSAEVTG